VLLLKEADRTLLHSLPDMNFSLCIVLCITNSFTAGKVCKVHIIIELYRP